MVKSGGLFLAGQLKGDCSSYRCVAFNACIVGQAVQGNESYSGWFFRAVAWGQCLGRQPASVVSGVQTEGLHGVGILAADRVVSIYKAAVRLPGIKVWSTSSALVRIRLAAGSTSHEVAIVKIYIIAGSFALSPLPAGQRVRGKACHLGGVSEASS